MNSGQASNLSPVYFVPYSMYRSALIADASSANDISALSSLPFNAGRDPILGNAYLDVKSADGRAVGFNTSGLNLTLANTSGFCAGFNLDGCIGLNVSNMTSDDLIQIVEHQIDQVLGLGSSLFANGTVLYNKISPEDLFRYAGVGSRSFALNSTCPGSNAYFSIDQGVTFLDQFNNCSDGFGYADFTTYVSSQVQIAYSSFLPVSNLSSSFIETVPLDVIGYNVSESVVVPEPTGLLLLGLGLLIWVVFRFRTRLFIKSKAFSHY